MWHGKHCATCTPCSVCDQATNSPEFCQTLASAKKNPLWREHDVTCAPSILCRRLENATISASTITFLVTLPPELPPPVAFFVSPKASRIILRGDNIREYVYWYIMREDEPVYAISIKRRVSLALAKNGDLRTSIIAHLNMDLCAFTVIFGFSPNSVRSRKVPQGTITATTFDRFWNLLGTKNYFQYCWRRK